MVLAGGHSELLCGAAFAEIDSAKEAVVPKSPNGLFLLAGLKGTAAADRVLKVACVPLSLFPVLLLDSAFVLRLNLLQLLIGKLLGFGFQVPLELLELYPHALYLLINLPYFLLFAAALPPHSEIQIRVTRALQMQSRGNFAVEKDAVIFLIVDYDFFFVSVQVEKFVVAVLREGEGGLNFV